MDICVFGAGSSTIDQKYMDAVEDFCEMFSKKGHNLVFGGGSTGVMGASARGTKKGVGKVYGVVPKFFEGDTIEVLFRDCDDLQYTNDMAGRKHAMEDRAECFVIAPGGIGTYEEFFEVLVLKQLGRHKKPIALFNVDGFYNPLQEMLDFAIEHNFVRESCKQLYGVFSDPVEMLDYLENDQYNLKVEDTRNL